MRVHLIWIALGGLCGTAFADGDATQSIDSPLAPGSGVTLTASRSKTALTMGIQQQFASVFDWNAAFEGVVNDTDTLTVFSRSAGVGPGATLRLGLGYSGARAKPRGQAIAACGRLKAAYDEWKKTEVAQQVFESCAANLAALRQKAGLGEMQTSPLAGSDAAAACESETTKLFDELTALIDVGGANQQPVTDQQRRTQEALDALLKRRAATRDKLDTSGIESGLFGPAPDKQDDKSSGTCSELAREVKAIDAASLSPVRRSAYDRLYGIASQFENSDLGGRWGRAALSGYLGTVGGKFHPVGADGMPDFSTRKTWTHFLPGLSLDGALYFPDKILAGSVGFGTGIDDSPTRICRRVEQGSLFSEDCNNDYLQRPRRQVRAYTSFLLSLDPLASIGNIVFGAQVSFIVLTATAKVDGMDRNVFGSGSWHYKASVPLFFATSDMPWGLTAGIAPELSRAIDSKESEEVRLVLFVGTRPQAASR